MPQKLSRYLLAGALSGFVAVALLDPGDQILHLKMPLFSLVLCVWGLRVLFGVTPPGGIRLWACILLFAIIVPTAGSAIGLVNHRLPIAPPSFAILKGFTTLLLIPIIYTENVRLTRHIVLWSFFVALLTISFAVISIEAPILFTSVYDFTIEKGNAMLGPRDLLGLGLGSFYYKTVAVLVFPIAYFLQRIRNYPHKLVSLILLLIFLTAVACSGSRATALGTLCIVAAVSFDALRARVGSRAAVSAMVVLVLISTGYIAAFFQPDESSNAAKIGHLHSYVELFNDNPLYLVWGQGADTEFYSEAFQGKTSLTELSYVELIRQFGVPLTLLMVVALVYPTYSLTRSRGPESHLSIPYAVYLFEAATNPLLIGSTGLLVVGAVWGQNLIALRAVSSKNLEEDQVA